MIDHETAFSFCLDIRGPRPQPWNVAELPFLRDHIFFKRLRRQDGSLERFRERLTAISDADLDEMMDSIPPQWHDNRLRMIPEHLQAVRGHAQEFVEQVRGALR